MLFSTKHGNPQHFLLHGERGIGKSSLSYIHELAASGVIDGWEGQNYNFLTVSLILEPSDTYESILRKLGSSLRRKLASHNKLQKRANDTWDFLKRWEVMGVKYRNLEGAVTPTEMLDELVESYAKASEKIADTFDGILISIDEADKPPVAAHLGSLLKGFTERLSRASANKICLGIVGVSTVLDSLRESHESALRLFSAFHLKPLSQTERIEVIRKGLIEAEKKSGIKVSITPDAESYISDYSEGYPHFIRIAPGKAILSMGA